MYKKGKIILLIITVLITFTSCGLDYRYYLDEDLHGQIERIWDEDKPSHIIYQEEKYTFAGTTYLFDVNNYEDDTLLSWNGYRYVGYIDEYYSYTSDSPVFIYDDHMGWVYFHEDYDYLTDTFVVGDTKEEIVFQDIFGTKQEGVELINPDKIVISSSQYPRITIYVFFAYVNGQLYISIPDSHDVWIPSDKFIEILTSNELI